ncbi:hypothetical protein TOL_2356 [Thalassolituus oleivorans MIL-1]|uniref:Uncharacterized protein n=1 Tax=Thalassolituus oleivorans MIL-1 TaxID=1298593 RepID=M5DU46_9GAMM|nr:hypothetical protein TOL_2356 [Thalassolituus oleivorans MIL-1]
MACLELFWLVMKPASTRLNCLAIVVEAFHELVKVTADQVQAAVTDSGSFVGDYLLRIT